MKDYDGTKGRWPTNVVLSHSPVIEDGEIVGDACANGCVEGCAVRSLDLQTGVSRSRVGKPRQSAAGDGWGMTKTGTEYDDAGGASRFFPAFRYEAKAPGAERPEVDGMSHATVKPLSLMQWLVRLVTQPGGIVLDHFGGSGTTGEAALLEGMQVVLIELEADHLPLIMQRIKKPLQQSLFGDIE